jgi:hypothetical protein
MTPPGEISAWAAHLKTNPNLRQFTQNLSEVSVLASATLLHYVRAPRPLTKGRTLIVASSFDRIDDLSMQVLGNSASIIKIEVL